MFPMIQGRDWICLLVLNSEKFRENFQQSNLPDHYISIENGVSYSNDSNIPDLDNHTYIQPSHALSSFPFKLPNAKQEMEKIKNSVHTTSTTTPTTIDWPSIG